MIHAYNKLYLSDAQRTLSVFIDFGVNWLHIPIDDLWAIFLHSPLSEKFYYGDPFVISGKSGVELVYLAIDVSDFGDKGYFSIDRTPEYWLGTYLAYYSWYTNMSFKQLDKYIEIQELLSMYNPYHEMDVMNFVTRVNEIYNERKQMTNLELFRKKRKLSRSQLAELSEVPVRLIEQYEQRRKDINKANVTYVVSLAKALYVEVEDLLEIK